MLVEGILCTVMLENFEGIYKIVKILSFKNFPNIFTMFITIHYFALTSAFNLRRSPDRDRNSPPRRSPGY